MKQKLLKIQKKFKNKMNKIFLKNKMNKILNNKVIMIKKFRNKLYNKH